jgi:hypothetical protein
MTVTLREVQVQTIDLCNVAESAAIGWRSQKNIKERNTHPFKYIGSIIILKLLATRIWTGSLSWVILDLKLVGTYHTILIN